MFAAATLECQHGPRQPLRACEGVRERREVHYSGHVQGVGFRYTVQHLAGGFSLAGFVRNLADGRVQLVAEGTPPELDRFLAAIDERMAGHIRDKAVDVRPATGEFSSFEIRY